MREVVEYITERLCRRMGIEKPSILLPSDVSPEGAPIRDTTESGPDVILGAAWPEKNTIYINTNVDGELEWWEVVCHELMHLKDPKLNHNSAAFREAMYNVLKEENKMYRFRYLRRWK